MRAQGLVPARLILPCVVVEIAEGSRQAVAAMRQRGPAERPQRILQTLRQCHEALTAEHDRGVLPIEMRIAAQRYDNVERFIDTAINSADRAAALTHRLLAFARELSRNLGDDD